MNTNKQADVLTITLSTAEVELLALALKRATFEDTPAERQNEILDFALGLLSRLESDGV